jgi:anaerobic dimethyl sulfoxide reductase subunit C (anchor subunit)
MGNGWHEWPLMIFTVFGQCVAGGFIVLALALMKGKLSREQQQRVVGSMFGLWVLMGIGFIASTMHLGSPLRAFNSLNRVGASSLSNEIASGAIFFAVGGIGWLLAVCKKLPAGLRSLWLVVTMVLGVIFVWMMVRVYNTIDTVPTWYTVWTPLSFFLTLFIGGPLLGYLLLRVAGVDGWAMRLLPVVTLLALLVSIMVVLMQGVNWPPSTAHSAGLRPGAGLWAAYGLARGAAGAGPGLLVRAADSRPQAGALAARPGVCSGAGGRDDWPRRILWSAYDRWDGYRQLISSSCRRRRAGMMKTCCR